MSSITPIPMTARTDERRRLRVFQPGWRPIPAVESPRINRDILNFLFIQAISLYDPNANRISHLDRPGDPRWV